MGDDAKSLLRGGAILVAAIFAAAIAWGNSGNREPTLDEVFLDVTGRTRERVAGQVQEVDR